LSSDVCQVVVPPVARFMKARIEAGVMSAIVATEGAGFADARICHVG
jgi:hypothetical protein